MDVDVTDPERALAEQDPSAGAGCCRPAWWWSQGEPATCWVHVPDGDPARLEVELEDGTWRRLDQIDHWVEPRESTGRRVGEATFEVPGDLPLGYHTLHAQPRRQQGHRHPDRHPRLAGTARTVPTRGRSWGFAAQLYSVRSRASWGVGDLADLADLAAWSAAGSAPTTCWSTRCTPPSRCPRWSRRPTCPRPGASSTRSTSASSGSPSTPTCRRPTRTVDGCARGARSSSEDVIDRDASWAAKRAALQLVHGCRAAPARGGVRRLPGAARRGPAPVRDLERARRGARQRLPGLAGRAAGRRRRPRSPRSRRRTPTASTSSTWLQWVARRAAAGAQAKAVGAGMSLGTMHDLAVGVHPGGADVGGCATLRHGIQVGAPPDPYNQIGQNWSQPPWRPDRLEELAYAPFRDLIAAVLRHAGGVRVDHIIGLFRLWWIPEGHPPSEGTYVRYDHEALVGVLALEAHRAGAVVVGEDLGVVEPSGRATTSPRAASWAPRSSGSSGTARAAAARGALAGVLPGLGHHPRPAAVRRLPGRRPRAAPAPARAPPGRLDEELAAADAERESWLAEVRRAPASRREPRSRRPSSALHRYLTLTPARLLCVALTDAVGDRRTQNQPGTTDEYPNWRVPLSGPDGAPPAGGRARLAARRRVGWSGTGPVGPPRGRVPP